MILNSFSAILENAAEFCGVDYIRIVQPPRWVTSNTPDYVNTVYGPFSGKPIRRQHFCPEVEWRKDGRIFLYVVPIITDKSGEPALIPMMENMISTIRAKALKELT